MSTEKTKESVIRQWIFKQKYRLPNSDYDTFCDTMRDWYKGEVEDVHKYTVNNGYKNVTVRRARMGMAKIIAEDFANLLLNEKVTIHADAFPALEDVLRENRFEVRGNNLVELAFAFGTGALVEYLDTERRPVINYIERSMIYPLEWQGTHVTACAFGSLLDGQNANGARYYIQIHEPSPSGYVIHNRYLNSKGNEMPAPDGIESDVETHCSSPTFQLIRPNIQNNYDIYSPYGMSVYGNAESLLEAVDITFDSYLNEFKTGRKRIIVPARFAKIEMQSNGTMRPDFDPNDTTFYAIGSDSEKGFEIVDPSIRAQEHEAGIQRMLNLLSKACGLGSDRYRFDADGAKTATEVISEKSDLYQSIKKHEILLREALTTMVRTLSCLFGGSPDIDVLIDFDDSIVEDPNAAIDKHIRLTGAGLESKRRAVMEILGVDEACAEQELQRIAEENRTVSGSPDDWFGGQA